MRVDGWSRSRQTDAMNMPADIMARRSTEKIKKEIMATAEHDQLSGMKRTEELKRGMERYNAMRTVEHDQLSGMKRTSDILKGQIDMLDTQISYSHFTQDHDYVEKVQSGQISSLDELNAARDQLQQKKDQGAWNSETQAVRDQR